MLVVVDQPATIGALPTTVARACGHQVADLPGWPCAGIADLYPGRAKTDARVAFVIAYAARSLPHTPRPADVGDEAPAELEVQVGFDGDLASEAAGSATASAACSPASTRPLERFLGPPVMHLAVLEILSRGGARPASTMPGAAN